MQRILISACLLGHRVRYDGGDKLCDADILQRWREQGRIISFCPEVAGGFPTPRAPAEISGSQGGAAVLMGIARVLEDRGRDVTSGFIKGANAALKQVTENGIRIAILKEGSPSCGSSYTYDGTFLGGTTNKSGVTTALLRAHGVQVFSELELLQAELYLNTIEADAA
jgi:uncharacterized protein YbbK (DUF523 family)